MNLRLFSLCVLCSFFVIVNCVGQSWQQQAAFPGLARDDGIAFSIGNYGYFGTGFAVGFQLMNDFYRYDPSNDSWLQLNNFSGTPRQYACGFTIGQKGFLFGGIDGTGNSLNDLWEYDPVSDT